MPFDVHIDANKYSYLSALSTKKMQTTFTQSSRKVTKRKENDQSQSVRS
jgi:hypothetical protein